jgi:hypothetical protein
METSRVKQFPIASDPLGCLVSHLTAKCYGEVHDRGALEVPVQSLLRTFIHRPRPSQPKTSIAVPRTPSSTPDASARAFSIRGHTFGQLSQPENFWLTHSLNSRRISVALSLRSFPCPINPVQSPSQVGQVNSDTVSSRRLEAPGIELKSVVNASRCPVRVKANSASEVAECKDRFPFIWPAIQILDCRSFFHVKGSIENQDVINAKRSPGSVVTFSHLSAYPRTSWTSSILSYIQCF